MQTIATAEVRWFYPGQIPAGVAAWFASAQGPIEYQSPRVDEYLLIRETDSVNVKFREGRIEVKQRYGEVVNREFVGGGVGAIEFWRKWSFDVDKKNSNNNFRGFGDDWLAVRKDRIVHIYALQADGRVAPVPDLGLVEHGCSLELTQIDAAGQHWWSICFEEMGPEDRLMETLVAVADQLLRSFTASPLSVCASYGYSAWLQRLFDSLPLT